MRATKRGSSCWTTRPSPCSGSHDAVNDSIDTTLSGSAHATTALPAEALDLVRGHHALANLDDERFHFYDNIARMLCPPSFVQGDAAERIGEWLLLLEAR